MNRRIILALWCLSFSAQNLWASAGQKSYDAMTLEEKSAFVVEVKGMSSAVIFKISDLQCLDAGRNLDQATAKTCQKFINGYNQMQQFLLNLTPQNSTPSPISKK